MQNDMNRDIDETLNSDKFKLIAEEIKSLISWAIYGRSGLDSIPMLEKIIVYLEEKYKKNGEWITTKRNRTIYYDESGNEIDGMIALAKMRPDRIWDGD